MDDAAIQQNPESLEALEIFQAQILEGQATIQQGLQAVQDNLTLLLEDQKTLKIMLHDQKKSGSFEGTAMDASLKRSLRLLHEAEVVFEIF